MERIQINAIASTALLGFEKNAEINIANETEATMYTKKPNTSQNALNLWNSHLLKRTETEITVRRIQ